MKKNYYTFSFLPLISKHRASVILTAHHTLKDARHFALCQALRDASAADEDRDCEIAVVDSTGNLLSHSRVAARPTGQHVIFRTPPISHGNVTEYKTLQKC